MTALHDTTDNAEGQLNANITAASVTFSLKTGEGAEFPQPENGTASVTTDDVTLTDTGNLGNLAVGQFIRNVTDGSYATILSTGTNTITHTRLKNGSLNTWTIGDEYQANEFVVTFEKRDPVTGDVTNEEKVLIKDRTGDIFNVRTRGFDGATAQTFDADDFCNLHTVSNTIDDIIQVINDSIKLSDTLETNIESNDTELEQIRDGESFSGTDTGAADAYAIAPDPAQGALVAGQKFWFIAANSNTGASTLDVNALGAKAINKEGGTALVSGDIVLGQGVVCIYDGTDFEMVSPVGVPGTSELEVLKVTTADGTAVGASTTAETDMDDNFVIPANNMVVGDVFKIEMGGKMNVVSGTGKFFVKLGSTQIGMHRDLKPVGTTFAWSATHFITVRSIGASGSVLAGGLLNSHGSPSVAFFCSPLSDPADNNQRTIETTVDTTGSLTLQISAQFTVSNASHTAQLTHFIVTKLNSP